VLVQQAEQAAAASVAAAGAAEAAADALQQATTTAAKAEAAAKQAQATATTQNKIKMDADAAATTAATAAEQAKDAMTNATKVAASPAATADAKQAAAAASTSDKKADTQAKVAQTAAARAAAKAETAQQQATAALAAMQQALQRKAEATESAIAAETTAASAAAEAQQAAAAVAAAQQAAAAQAAAHATAPGTSQPAGAHDMQVHSVTIATNLNNTVHKQSSRCPSFLPSAMPPSVNDLSKCCRWTSMRVTHYIHTPAGSQHIDSPHITHCSNCYMTTALDRQHLPWQMLNNLYAVTAPPMPAGLTPDTDSPAMQKARGNCDARRTGWEQAAAGTGPRCDSAIEHSCHEESCEGQHVALQHPDLTGSMHCLGCAVAIQRTGLAHHCCEHVHSTCRYIQVLNTSQHSVLACGWCFTCSPSEVGGAAYMSR
jgi:hypothetical protein